MWVLEHLIHGAPAVHQHHSRSFLWHTNVNFHDRLCWRVGLLVVYSNLVVKINSIAETKKDVIHSTVKMKRRKKAGSVSRKKANQWLQRRFVKVLWYWHLLYPWVERGTMNAVFLNPLTPMSNRIKISPYNINTISTR